MATSSMSSLWRRSEVLNRTSSENVESRLSSILTVPNEVDIPCCDDLNLISRLDYSNAQYINSDFLINPNHVLKLKEGKTNLLDRTLKNDEYMKTVYNNRRFPVKTCSKFGFQNLSEHMNIKKNNGHTRSHQCLNSKTQAKLLEKPNNYNMNNGGYSDQLLINNRITNNSILVDRNKRLCDKLEDILKKSEEMLNEDLLLMDTQYQKNTMSNNTLYNRQESGIIHLQKITPDNLNESIYRRNESGTINKKSSDDSVHIDHDKNNNTNVAVIVNTNRHNIDAEVEDCEHDIEENTNNNFSGILYNIPASRHALGVTHRNTNKKQMKLPYNSNRDRVLASQSNIYSAGKRDINKIDKSQTILRQKELVTQYQRNNVRNSVGRKSFSNIPNNNTQQTRGSKYGNNASLQTQRSKKSNSMNNASQMCSNNLRIIDTDNNLIRNASKTRNGANKQTNQVNNANYANNNNVAYLMGTHNRCSIKQNQKNNQQCNKFGNSKMNNSENKKGEYNKQYKAQLCNIGRNKLIVLSNDRDQHSSSRTRSHDNRERSTISQHSPDNGSSILDSSDVLRWYDSNSTCYNNIDLSQVNAALELNRQQLGVRNRDTNQLNTMGSTQGNVNDQNQQQDHSVTSSQPDAAVDGNTPSVRLSRRNTFSGNLNNFFNNVREYHNNNFNDFHDVSSQVSHLRANTTALIAFLYKFVPFLLIFFTKTMYDYKDKVLIFFDLFVTFSHSNSVLTREVIKHSHRSLYSLLIIFFNLLGGILFVYNFQKDKSLCTNIMFSPPFSHPGSVFDLLWIVGITDFILKLLTIICKAFVVALPGSFIPYRKRGKIYLFLEATSQLYRSLVPIPAWFFYLMESYQGSEKLVGVILTGMYVVIKVVDLIAKCKFWKNAVWKLTTNKDLGVKATREQLEQAGNQCPICCDEYRAPVILRCGHIFCEGCLASWFDRKQTCPLCRSPVGHGWRDGATTYIPQLY